MVAGSEPSTEVEKEKRHAHPKFVVRALLRRFTSLHRWRTPHGAPDHARRSSGITRKAALLGHGTIVDRCKKHIRNGLRRIGPGSLRNGVQRAGRYSNTSSSSCSAGADHIGCSRIAAWPHRLSSAHHREGQFAHGRTALPGSPEKTTRIQVHYPSVAPGPGTPTAAEPDEPTPLPKNVKPPFLAEGGLHRRGPKTRSQLAYGWITKRSV